MNRYQLINTYISSYHKPKATVPPPPAGFISSSYDGVDVIHWNVGSGDQMDILVNGTSLFAPDLLAISPGPGSYSFSANAATPPSPGDTIELDLYSAGSIIDTSSITV